MHFLTALLPLLALVSASHTPPHLRHRRLAHAIEQREPGALSGQHSEAQNVVKKNLLKRGQTCRPRPQQQVANALSSSPSSSTTTTTTSTTTTAAAAAAATTTSSTIDNQNAVAHNQPSTTTQAPTTTTTTSQAPAATQDNSNNNSGGWHGGAGLLQVNDGKCGWCNSDDNSPNGNIDWLNCGINDGGWAPPHVRLDQIKAKDLDNNGVFAPCSQYFDMFKQYGGEFGIPPIMLASFAMQESTCNQWATGGGGEAGLMQIAPPNCEAGHNCYDVNYNIRRAAQLFSNMVNSNGGNVVAAIGSYNGWRVGMTYDDATRARYQGNCLWQNNLDYLTQFLNGWMQGKSGYSIGKYWNLKGC